MKNKTDTMRDLARNLTVCAFVAALVVAAAYYVLSLPRVHWSHNTGACVRVEKPTEYSCENLPDKYIHIVVY